jgi:hypothetical protein
VTDAVPPTLLRAARSCGLAWAESGCTCSPDALELTAEDCAYIKTKHPRAWNKAVVLGDALPAMEDEMREAYSKARGLA